MNTVTSASVWARVRKDTEVCGEHIPESAVGVLNDGQDEGIQQGHPTQDSRHGVSGGGAGVGRWTLLSRS